MFKQRFDLVFVVLMVLACADLKADQMINRESANHGTILSGNVSGNKKMNICRFNNLSGQLSVDFSR